MSKKKKKVRPYDPARDTGEKTPVRIRIAAGDPNDKYSSYPGNGLTPVRLAQIFREADSGDVLRQMELFEEMEEKDAHLFSQLQTRKLAVTGLEWEVQPCSNEERDRQVAAFIRKQLENMEFLNDALLDMLDAIGKGISVLEIGWTVRDGFNAIESLEWVHQKKLFWDSMTDEMLLRTTEHPEGISFPHNKFVVHRYKARSGHESRAGLLRASAWMYLFKNYTLKDWVSFCEVFGMPIRLGKYDQSASEEDKRQLLEAIYSIGSDAAGIIPDSAMIEFIEANKTSTVDIYERLARYCDEQMSKAILGQTLTSDSGGGSYAQGKVHNDVRKDLTKADAGTLEMTIRRDIIGPLVEYNFGPGIGLPVFKFNSEEPEELKDTIEIYRTLSVDMGLQIPSAHVYEKFNIPEPKEGEKLLSPSRDQILTDSYSMKEPVQEGQIEKLTAWSKEKAGELFVQMARPLMAALQEAESPEELQRILKDEGRLRELYEEMDGVALQDLIAQGLYLAELVGRAGQ